MAPCRTNNARDGLERTREGPGPPGDAGAGSGLAVLPLLLAWALALGGCASQPKERDFDVVVGRFYLETAPQDPNAELAILPRGSVQIPVSPRFVLSEIDYVNVELVQVEMGLCLLFEFAGDSARNLYRITSGNLGRRLVVKLNGKPFGVRVIDGPITDGRLFIFVELPDDELATEAVNLKRTALEVVQPAARKSRGK